MDNPESQRLRESVWRKEPTPEQRTQLEETELAAREIQDELKLTRMLKRLPDAPVSSNFTARVLQAARKPAPAPAPGWWQRLAPHRWVPRLAVATLMVCIGLFSVEQYKSTQNTRMAHDLVSVSEVAQLSDVEWLDNFETIDRMSRVQAGDDELLMSLR